MKRCALCLVIVAFVFALASCDLFALIFGGGEPPFKVSLAVEGNRTEVHSDEPINLTATIDPPGTGYSFAWYIDGTVVPGVTVPQVWYSGLAEAQRTVVIKVVATDEKKNTNETEIALKVLSTASIRIENLSGATIVEVYFQADPDPVMANTDLFSTNRIAGKTLSSPGKFIIFGLPPGNYDFAAYTNYAQTGLGWYDDMPSVGRFYSGGRPKQVNLTNNGMTISTWMDIQDPKNQLVEGGKPWALKY